MSHEPSKGWIDRLVHGAMQSQTDALRSEVHALRIETQALRTGMAEMQVAIAELRAQNADVRATILALGGEVSAHTAHVDASLLALREAVDRDDRPETLRLRLEGLSAQHRWDTDQLRQALAAIAERLPLGD